MQRFSHSKLNIFAQFCPIVWWYIKNFSISRVFSWLWFNLVLISIFKSKQFIQNHFYLFSLYDWYLLEVDWKLISINERKNSYEIRRKTSFFLKKCCIVRMSQSKSRGDLVWKHETRRLIVGFWCYALLIKFSNEAELHDCYPISLLHFEKPNFSNCFKKIKFC